jgi:N,N'-diacetyllegionaminate synthase
MISIGNRKIGQNQPSFLIAEAGVNHNGEIRLAKELIDAARSSGADAVKFQTFSTDDLVVKGTEKADYQKRTTKKNESQYDMLLRLEFSAAEFKELSDYARKKGILFLSTPFDPASVDLLDNLNVPAYKISSGDLTNIPLLEKIASKNKPVILSTGMASLGEIEDSVSFLRKNNVHDFILLHCTTQYPTDIRAVNLKNMNTLRCAFNCPVGFSDHTEGLTAAITAVALGACIIEKHFTLDKSLPGPDHEASVEPDSFRLLVDTIRDVETILGSETRHVSAEEQEIQRIARKSLIAIADLRKGEKFSQKSLAVKRPGTGIPPKFFNHLLTRKARVPIGKDTVLSWEMIE